MRFLTKIEPSSRSMLISWLLLGLYILSAYIILFIAPKFSQIFMDLKIKPNSIHSFLTWNDQIIGPTLLVLGMGIVTKEYLMTSQSRKNTINLLGIIFGLIMGLLVVFGILMSGLSN